MAASMAARTVRPTARGRARPRMPAAKREAILAAALELFGRYGYRRTSIDDIAQAAGVAKGTVYLYVPNKETLFRTLSESLLGRVLHEAEVAAEKPGRIGERLAAVLHAKFGFFFELLHRSPHASELLDSKNALCADVFAAGEAAYLRVLTRLMAEAVRRGELAIRRHGLTVGQAARLLLAGAHGLDAPTVAPLSLADHRQQLDALVRVMVDGLGPR